MGEFTSLMKKLNGALSLCFSTHTLRMLFSITSESGYCLCEVVLSRLWPNEWCSATADIDRDCSLTLAFFRCTLLAKLRNFPVTNLRQS